MHLDHQVTAKPAQWPCANATTPDNSPDISGQVGKRRESGNTDPLPAAAALQALGRGRVTRHNDCRATFMA